MHLRDGRRPPGGCGTQRGNKTPPCERGSSRNRRDYPGWNRSTSRRAISTITRRRRFLGRFKGRAQGALATEAAARMPSDATPGTLPNLILFFDELILFFDEETVMPQAVRRDRDGYLRVYYDKLGVTFQTYDHWIALGARVPAGATRP